jgi:hypothetical protein
VSEQVRGQLQSSRGNVLGYGTPKESAELPGKVHRMHVGGTRDITDSDGCRQERIDFLADFVEPRGWLARASYAPPRRGDQIEDRRFYIVRGTLAKTPKHLEKLTHDCTSMTPAPRTEHPQLIVECMRIDPDLQRPRAGIPYPIGVLGVQRLDDNAERVRALMRARDHLFQ